MKKLLSSIDLQDLQLVVGISMLGCGLFLVSPALALTTIGSLVVIPVWLPPLVKALRGA